MTTAFDPALVLANFPADLRCRRQWVVWRLEERKGQKKLTKIPYTTAGAHASSTDAATWCSLDDALAAVAAGRYAGVGFVFAGDGLVGVDLDHCRDAATGAIATWAKEILDRVAGYSEVSPSGTGIHIIVGGTLPGGGRKRRVRTAGADPAAAIEIYDRGRYFTVTGARLPEYPPGIEERQAVVDELYASIDSKGNAATPSAAKSPSGGLDDGEVLRRAMASKSGAAILRLWNGLIADYGDDDSAADLALCSHLAFWCGGSVDQLDRLFRRSKLYREKWDRADYRDRTIAKAIEGRTEFYSGGGARPPRGSPSRVEDGEYLLIPGQHITADGEVFEIGTDDFADAVLARLPLGTLYRMDTIVGEVTGDPGQRRFVEMSENRFRAVIDGCIKLAKWIRAQSEDPVRKFVACNRDQAAVVLAAAASSPRVHELNHLVHHPVYDRDLNLTRPGWNPTSGIYYDAPEVLRGLLPRPEGAVEVLLDLIVDFPFLDGASRENAIGLMLTLVLRPAVEKVPFHLVKSPMERTGKGKLLDAAVGEAVLGCGVAPMQVGKTEEEREKRITSLILAGITFVHLDNLPLGEVLDSPALASLATAWPRWRGRKLGVSTVLSLPNTVVVALSGNNPKLTGEITKRTVPIVLQPLDDHPEDREKYVHPEAEPYARSRHRAVIEALTGLVEAWKTAGRPTGRHGRRMGGFEVWVRLVGDVLHHAGLTAWMGNYRDWVRVGDEWTADAETLVEKWAGQYQHQEIKATDVLGMLKDLGIFTTVTARPEAAQGSALGKRVLVPLVDRPVGNWVVRRSGKGGSVRYRLTRALPEGETPPTPPKTTQGLFGPEGSEGLEGFHIHTHARCPSPSGFSMEGGDHPSDPSDPSDGGGDDEVIEL